MTDATINPPRESPTPNPTRDRPPTRLWVIYDGSCAFCERCREWLAAEPTHLPLVFVRRESPLAARWLAQVLDRDQPAEMNVVDSEGRFYRGPAAWLACLWATRRYREWSYMLAHPRYRKGLKRVIALLARHRSSLSFVFGRKTPAWNDVEVEARKGDIPRMTSQTSQTSPTAPPTAPGLPLRQQRSANHPPPPPSPPPSQCNSTACDFPPP